MLKLTPWEEEVFLVAGAVVFVGLASGDASLPYEKPGISKLADIVLDAPAKKSHKLAAEEPSLWQVGSQIAIEPEKHGVRSHVRRAHWHGYWTGAGRKNFELKWLHPILVKGKEDQLPADGVNQMNMDQGD